MKIKTSTQDPGKSSTHGRHSSSGSLSIFGIWILRFEGSNRPTIYTLLEGSVHVFGSDGDAPPMFQIIQGGTNNGTRDLAKITQGRRRRRT
jgi:hypothetical protein